MKSKELKQALRLIGKVSADSRVEPGQGDRLQVAKRELETVMRSGKVDPHRIYRAVEIIATVLEELVDR